MIELTRLNSRKIVINCDLIESFEAVPDTTISLTTGNKFVVRESVNELIDKIVYYRQRCNTKLTNEKGGF